MRGQSEAAATKQLEEVKGLTYARITTSSGFDGLTPRTDGYSGATIEAGAAVKDAAALLDYILALSWSANEHQPENGISVNFGYKETVVVDWASVAKKAGWKTEYSSTPSRVQLSFSELKKRLGGWPGKVPAIATKTLVSPAR